MADTGTPPEIPAEFQQYNSYVIDPQWQRKFTIAWAAFLAFCVVVSLPRLFSALRRSSGSVWSWGGGAFGVVETTNKTDPRPQECSRQAPKGRPRGRSTRVRMAARVLASLGSVFYWTPPGIGLNAGQMLLIAAYTGLVLACILTSSPLLTNSNRAGFMALAQLPPVILLASKSSPLALLFSSPPARPYAPSSFTRGAGISFAYTRLNVFHRWAGRLLMLSALLHGALWINNHVVWGIQIIGQQKETSGVAALGVLGAIGLSSLRVVRRAGALGWAVFSVVHFLGFPAFFITICYHTMYAAPYIFPPLAFYAFDVIARIGRGRVKDAWLGRVDGDMTLIYIPDCDAGFHGGQHLRIRVFFEGRGVFESHPLSVMCAPRGATCLGPAEAQAYFGGGEDVEGEYGYAEEKGEGRVSPGREGAGILLGARVMGDWTGALNEYARVEGEKYDQLALLPYTAPSTSSPAGGTAIQPTQKKGTTPVPVQVMFDGPYGGCTLDLPAYERVLLVAGGSGATFTIGVLDELVAAWCLGGAGAGGGVRRIDFVWCIRSFGSIKWFAPLLRAIALTAAASLENPNSDANPARTQVDLRVLIYVTCFCAREALPDVPGLEVRIGGRPDMRVLVGNMMGGGGGSGAGKGKGGVDADMEMCTCGCADAVGPALAGGEEGDGESVGSEEDEKYDEKEAGRSCCVSGDEEGRFEGRLAVCASGPESLTREAANAVARWAGVGRGAGVGLYTEVFAI